MFENFPVKVVDPLPSRLDPCPIVEAAFEIRFTTSTPWIELPGLVSNLLDKKKYKGRKELALYGMPDEWKQRIPGAVHIPHYQFTSDQFIVNLAPQMIGLCAQTMRYPGWNDVEKELRTFLESITSAGFMEEGARLGVRYTDFFDRDIFDNVDLDVSIQGKPITDKERQFTTVFQEGRMTVRLVLANAAVMANAHGPRRGSVLDVDVAFDAMDFDLNPKNVLERFTEAHALIKTLFFGLIDDELLASLKPEYP